MIERVGIVGAGTMGAGIAINCVTNGLGVVLVDRNAEVLEKAQDKLAMYLSRQVAKDRLSADEVAPITARLSVAESVSALAGCDLVIEAVFEKLELKQSVFREVEAAVPVATILATNTSALRLADIAGVLAHPERFCGMHYFSPAEINPVVELIRGAATDAGVLEAAEGFLRATRKEVIACADQNGFALNRFFCPYTNEAVRMLDAGLATTGQLDEVAKATFGLALGPFAVMNIIGTATNLGAVRNLRALGPSYAAAAGLIAKGEHNTPWEIEDDPAPLVHETAAEIAARLEDSVLLTVSEELAEGTATLEAIDRGAAKAFRFGRTPGAIMKELGAEETAARVRAYAARYA